MLFLGRLRASVNRALRSFLRCVAHEPVVYEVGALPPTVPGHVHPDRGPRPAPGQRCACCGRPAWEAMDVSGRSLRLPRRSDAPVRSSFTANRAPSVVLSVPYCSECVGHTTRIRTRLLTRVLASGLCGFAFGAGLPILWPHASLLTAWGATLIAAGWPLLVPSLEFRTISPHTTKGRAVWVGRFGNVICTRREFARWVERQLRGEPSRANGRSDGAPFGVRARRWRWLERFEWHPALLSGLLGATALIFWSYAFHHPRMRVLNQTGATLWVAVDDHLVARLPSTGTESPWGGVEIRVPAGERRLSVLSDSGEPLAEKAVRLLAGREHLFVPRSHDRCFFLETTHYGRTAKAAVDRIVLDPGAEFWLLPLPVDVWFSPAPMDPGQSRTSGGTLTALRQGDCPTATE